MKGGKVGEDRAATIKLCNAGGKREQTHTGRKKTNAGKIKAAQLIPVILSARTISEGVETAGISRTSFYKWMTNPDFKAEFDRQTRDMVSVAACGLRLSTGEAIEKIRALMDAEAEAVQLRAAMAILDYNSRFLEIQGLTERIEKIEEVIKNEHRRTY